MCAVILTFHGMGRYRYAADGLKFVQLGTTLHDSFIFLQVTAVIRVDF